MAIQHDIRITPAIFKSWPLDIQRSVISLIEAERDGRIDRDEMARKLRELRIPGVVNVQPRPRS